MLADQHRTQSGLLYTKNCLLKTKPNISNSKNITEEKCYVEKFESYFGIKVEFLQEWIKKISLLLLFKISLVYVPSPPEEEYEKCFKTSSFPMVTAE